MQIKFDISPERATAEFMKDRYTDDELACVERFIESAHDEHLERQKAEKKAEEEYRKARNDDLNNFVLPSPSSDEEDNMEDHKYYVAQKVPIDDQNPYVDLDRMNETYPNIVKEHPMLSRSYRRAATISLTFK